MGKPASVAPNQCKTSLAHIYGLQSEPSPALHVPTSPLLQSLLEDANSNLSKFVEDQTVHGFLPVLNRRHRRCYRTSSSSSSFPGPFTVMPGLASITLESMSESQKCSVSLSHSQVSNLETMLSCVCEVTSWLDWWLSTCGGFREHLTGEVCTDFKRLMLSGSRALEFLGGQGIMALDNLVLSRRDSLLLDICSMVPAEEVAHLRYAVLLMSTGLFPTSLLETALVKMRAASNYTLVQKTLNLLRIPRKSSSLQSKAASSSVAFLAAPVVPQSKQAPQTALLLLPLPRAGSGRDARERLPFHMPLAILAVPVASEGGLERSPLRVGGLSVSTLEALAGYWSRVLGRIHSECRVPPTVHGLSSSPH